MKKLRILFIEDNRFDYELLIQHLEENAICFTSDHAANAAELMEILNKNNNYAWDLVISDYSLPDIDIRSKLHWLMAKLRNIPVILVSGTIGEETAIDLLRDGVDDFVNKDKLTRLIPAIERATKAAAVYRANEAAAADLDLRNRALASVSNGVLISSADDDMPVVYANAAFQNMTGYSMQEIVGENCRILQNEEHDQPGLAELRKGLAEQRACRTLLRNYRKDGTLFWNDLSIAPVLNRRGRTTHFVGVMEDVTKRRQHEEFQRRAAAVFNNTTEGMIVTDLSGNIVEINQAFTEITGYAREEAVGQNPKILSSGRHEPGFFQSLWDEITQEGSWRGEIWNRRKSGEVYPEWLTISTVVDNEGRPAHYVALFSDLSEAKKSAAELDYLTQHDLLTGLPNRTMFNARLDHHLERALRDDSKFAVLLIDLDRFKQINDHYGHPEGDRLLKQVGERLRDCIPGSDTLSRIGGNEFAVIVHQIDSPKDAAVVARRILQALSVPFETSQGGPEQFITASIGISTYPRNGLQQAGLLRAAETAMKQVKSQGRRNYRFFATDPSSHDNARFELENDLYKAVEANQLCLHYQPRIDLRTGKTVGVEALVRWLHPQRGLLPPGQFIPIAEECGLIVDIGEWVLQAACAQGYRWMQQNIAFGRISVNIAAQQLDRSNMDELVRKALDTTRLPAQRLELEITESSIMRETQKTLPQLDALRALGVSLSIDDFGTGYSSLAYLKRLSVDFLKIDRSFVQDLPGDSESQAIARAIIALADTLTLGVVAEGIETQAQGQFLVQQGCQFGQGFLFSHPLPADDFSSWTQD